MFETIVILFAVLLGFCLRFVWERFLFTKNTDVDFRECTCKDKSDKVSDVKVNWLDARNKGLSIEEINQRMKDWGYTGGKTAEQIINESPIGHKCCSAGAPGDMGEPGQYMSIDQAVELFNSLKHGDTYFERRIYPNGTAIGGDPNGPLFWNELTYAGQGEAQTPVYITNGLMNGTIKLSK